MREISETLPNTYAMVVRSITEFDRLYTMYEAGDKSVFAVFSKERARDGYMRYPAVALKRYGKQHIFVCPDCGKPILQEYSDDGTKYFDYALHEKQIIRGFTMTGILLDKARPGMTFSLKRFCQNVYRTSELLGDEIVRELVANRV